MKKIKRKSRIILCEKGSDMWDWLNNNREQLIQIEWLHGNTYAIEYEPLKG